MDIDILAIAAESDSAAPTEGLIFIEQFCSLITQFNHISTPVKTHRFHCNGVSFDVSHRSEVQYIGVFHSCAWSSAIIFIITWCKICVFDVFCLFVFVL